MSSKASCLVELMIILTIGGAMGAVVLVVIAWLRAAGVPL